MCCQQPRSIFCVVVGILFFSSQHSSRLLTVVPSERVKRYLVPDALEFVVIFAPHNESVSLLREKIETSGSMQKGNKWKLIRAGDDSDEIMLQ